MMSRTFASISGTYNVRANELSRQHKNTKSIRCLVYFLDDSQHIFEVDRRAKGHQLLDLVFRHLELIERDYFALQFSDSSNNTITHLRWLDPNKRIRKQMKSGAPYLLYFKVKFYVTEPIRLLEEYTRYHFFLQIKKDILSGKLVAPLPELVILASYAVQSELGDYCPDEHKPGYISQLKLIPNQTGEFEESVCELHALHCGQTPADAEFNYLEHAKRLDMYGIELHRAKDSNQQDIQIGVSGNGLLVFQNGIKINTYSWAKIIKISFKRRHFFVLLRREGTERFDNMLGFYLCSYRACKSLWKSCVEQHTFFRLQTPKPHTRKFFFFFSLGSKFRYSGKTEYQTLEESKKRLTRTERTFVRTRTSRFTRKTVPIPHINNLMITTTNASNNSPTTAATQYKLTNGTNNNNKLTQISPSSAANFSQLRPYESFNHKIQSTESPSRIPRNAWSSENNSSSPSAYRPTAISLKSIQFIDKESSAATESSAHSSHSPHNRLSSLSEEISPVHLACIRMRPDKDGRFGFNVKGGYDQNCPVLVSRVAPNTPADNATPKLREGDQVMTINGKDVNGLTHDQIVQLIRSTRDAGINAELVLTIRPNVYSRNGVMPEEPDFQYIPADVSPTSRLNDHCDPLQESMLLLHEGLESGSTVLQFEQLYRKKCGESMNSARMSDNLCKNRYRDISPYDSTRVVLNDCLTGDYINASFVNMEIPTCGVINRYIATQGPLKETSEDFWQMVYEQKCPLIIMVTPLEEKGRKKCHKYWPEEGEELTVYGTFKITLTKQLDSRSFIEREFKLLDCKSHCERFLTHLQYLAWPDHGVPDQDSDFLQLIFKVRQFRVAFCEPFIVHCSAGIGRTGVLILMETGMCLIEANQPIYPLELVRAMRDQRAMLIQTSAQFRFVCDALSRVYKEKLVQPLPQFRL